mgnify:CR=1 FL=1
MTGVEQVYGGALYELAQKEQLTDLLLEPVYIPKTMKLNAIMNEFRKSQTHMAVVMDEYGGTSGLVTLEALLEELVGDIQDESDTGEGLQLM